MDAPQVGELLVRQRLERRGVEGLAALLDRHPDSELADHRLTGPGGSGDEDRLAAEQCLQSFGLESVETERVTCFEAFHQSAVHQTSLALVKVGARERRRRPAQGSAAAGATGAAGAGAGSVGVPVCATGGGASSSGITGAGSSTCGTFRS